MESTDSSTITPPCPPLPPGFRFHPTDEELIVHYLARKAASSPLPVSIIAEVDLYKFDPWELPSKATFGENEWYFFSPRERKYPNGARPNRAATSGYWKATGTDKPILATTTSSDGRRQKVGVKKALVFYGGKPPRGIKTEWIMHEFRLLDNTASAAAAKAPRPDLSSKRTGSSLRLDDWVLCRIYKKNNVFRPVEEHLHHPHHHLFLGRSFPCAANFFDGVASGPPELQSISDHFRIQQGVAKQAHLLGNSDHQQFWDDEMGSTSTAAPGSVETDPNSGGGGGGSFVSLLNQLPQHSALLDPLGTASFCDSHFSSPSTATWNS
ncbi:hypothetical protein V2J09_019588 [Rumex salicifolius]